MTKPETRKPALAGTGFQEKKSDLHGAFERKNTPTAALLQAAYLHRRFGISRPLAGHVAELAFDSGGRRDG